MVPATTRLSPVSITIGSVPLRRNHEYLDHFVCDFVDSVAWGLCGVSRRWWPDSLVTSLRSDLLNRSFCNGGKNCINAWPAYRSPFETSHTQWQDVLLAAGHKHRPFVIWGGVVLYGAGAAGEWKGASAATWAYAGSGTAILICAILLIARGNTTS